MRVSADQPGPEDSYAVVDIDGALVRNLRQAAAQTAEKDSGAALPLVTGDTAAEYLIGPGDILSIIVWDHPELTNPFGSQVESTHLGNLVAADGTIYFPYAGRVPAAGHTIHQLRDDLASRLSRVIKDPQVNVKVTGYRSQRIQVTGEVKTPGVVTLDDTPKGVLEAINERGGLAPTASHRSVILIRKDASDARQAYRVDLRELVSGDRPGRNPVVKAGDIIHIPDQSSDQVFVLGEVNRPAPVPMGGSAMTITQAIASASGMAPLSANDSGILVFRLPDPAQAEQKATVFKLDMSHPAGVLLAGQFELQPRDVVYVKATGFSQYNLLIQQLLPTVETVFYIDTVTRRR